jgi:hypothetical protein
MDNEEKELLDVANFGDNEDVVTKTMDYHKLESDSEIDKYELMLRGWERKPGVKGVWIRPKTNFRNRFDMHDEAVKHCITSRRALLTKSVIQANLSGNNKWKLFDDAVDNYMDAFDAVLMMHGEDWNLSCTQCDVLSAEIEEYLRLILTRTLDNKERERDLMKETVDHDVKSNVKGDWL